VIESVAPIQLGIRLLIPEGSRMLELENVRRLIEPFDAQSLASLGKMSTAPRRSQRNGAGDRRRGGAAKGVTAGYIRAHLEGSARCSRINRLTHQAYRRAPRLASRFLSEPCIAVPSRPGTSWSPSRPEAAGEEIPRKR